MIYENSLGMENSRSITQKKKGGDRGARSDRGQREENLFLDLLPTRCLGAAKCQKTRPGVSVLGRITRRRWWLCWAYELSLYNQERERERGGTLAVV